MPLPLHSPDSGPSPVVQLAQDQPTAPSTLQQQQSWALRPTLAPLDLQQRGSLHVRGQSPADTLKAKGSASPAFAACVPLHTPQTPLLLGSNWLHGPLQASPKTQDQLRNTGLVVRHCAPATGLRQGPPLFSPHPKLNTQRSAARPCCAASISAWRPKPQQLCEVRDCCAIRVYACASAAPPCCGAGAGAGACGGLARGRMLFFSVLPAPASEPGAALGPAAAAPSPPQPRGSCCCSFPIAACSCFCGCCPGGA